MEDGDTFSVWTALKSSLNTGHPLHQFIARNSSVIHIAGPGAGPAPGIGPVLMSWPTMDDIGVLARAAKRFRALCVVSLNETLAPWVTATGAEVLGDGSTWAKPTRELDPIVAAALHSITGLINQSNSISVGHEKDVVVGALLALNAAGVPMDPAVMQGWALAHGWAGDNPKDLAMQVTAIKAGKRHRHKSVLAPGFVEELRRQASGS